MYATAMLLPCQGAGGGLSFPVPLWRVSCPSPNMTIQYTVYRILIDDDDSDDDDPDIYTGM